MSSKNFLVVGGSGGIGLALVNRLLNADHHVTVVSRTDGELDLNHPQLRHVTADITESIPDDQFPESINGFAFCPGSINLGPLRGLKPESMMSDYLLNVVSAITCVQAVAPRIKKAGGGSIVLFSTVAVQTGMPMHTSVAAVKGAIEGITRTLAAEFAPTIRVNAIAPALVDTPLASRFLSSDEKRGAMDKRHPLGRIGTVDDIAAAAEYLITDSSSWVTGQILGVDGGISAVKIG